MNTSIWSSFPQDWFDVLPQGWMEGPVAKKLDQFLHQEQQKHTVYPSNQDRWNALIHTPFSDVRVVIVGQDPYHGPGQAHGLSFSVPQGQPLPPSLRNIFQELHTDVGGTIPAHGDLTHWAQQGVLLLNTSLSVRAHEAGSHQGQGWEELTDALLQAISQHHEHVVFVLWGSHAQKKKHLIDPKKHLLLTCVHPSPLSAYRGFFGSRPFSQINHWLLKHNLNPIEWTAPNDKQDRAPKATSSYQPAVDRKWKRVRTDKSTDPSDSASTQS